MKTRSAKRRALYLTADRFRGEPVMTPPAELPTHVKLRVGGERRKLPVSYWWKDAISVGRYTHPATGQRFSVNVDRIDRWVEKFRRMRAAGVEVPTPVDHSDAAEDNRGFVIAARRQGNTLQLMHQAIGKRAAVMASRNRVSVYIEPDFVDSTGKHWGEVIAHSAYTPKPVVHGHGGFVPFAASRSTGRAKRAPRFYLSRDVRGGGLRQVTPEQLAESAARIQRREEKRLAREAEQLTAETTAWAKRRSGGGVVTTDPVERAAANREASIRKLVGAGMSRDVADRFVDSVERHNAGLERTAAEEAKRKAESARSPFNPLSAMNALQPTALGMIVGIGSSK